jgi:hypothetical protein
MVLIVLIAMGGFVGAVVSAMFMGRRGGGASQGGQLQRSRGTSGL